MSGRVYRRCGCRTTTGALAGAQCPTLRSNGKHGTWVFAVDLARVNGKRKTLRRGGFATEREAKAALKSVGDRVQTSVTNDDRETVAEYLAAWMQAKRHELKPKTMHQYGLYVTKDLTPALGGIKLEALRYEHIGAMVNTLEAAGRGACTIKRIVAVLSSALGHAVKTRRLTHNAAEHVSTPTITTTERVPWTATQAVQFLEHVDGDRLAEFFEVMVGTGLRRGEALGLRWQDVDLEHRVLRVVHAASEVDGKLIIGAPKTKGSAAGVGLSERVVAALRRQRDHQLFEALEWGDGYEASGLVFTRENGAMLRPRYLLAHFHKLSEAAGVPQVRIHDLRHLAATLMITNGVPLALVSKTLRHSQVGITANLYGHLTQEAAHAAADSLGGALDTAQAKMLSDRATHDATTLRPHQAN
jgi:integrase